MTSALPSLSWFFLFAFALNGLVAISILFFKNRTLRVANSLLAINLLGISSAAIMISLVESKLILEIPHYYRAPSPLYYLMFPAAYLYAKLILTDRTQLESKDYLHALPAVLHLVEMMPYYLLSREEKVNHITEVFSSDIQFYAHNEGWLPAFAHNIIRGLMAVIYAIAMWKIIRKSATKYTSTNVYTATVLRWLKTFTIINAAIGTSAIVFLSLVFIPADIRSFSFHLIFLSALLITNFYLFFKPEILYGLPQPVTSKKHPFSSEKLRGDLVDELSVAAEPETQIPTFIYQYKDFVHQYLVESKRYLDPEFNLQDLARETNIPKHHLQLLINKVEEKRFSEYINDYRILHMKDQIERGSLKNKTLEGLASESGFSSKATFIRTIKKHTGKTPRDYFIHQNVAA